MLERFKFGVGMLGLRLLMLYRLVFKCENVFGGGRG